MKPPHEPIGVLFVCLGNICRSPMAEGVFRHMVKRQGIADHFVIDSAGTSSWHVGSPPDERAQEAALLRGMDIGAQIARKVRDEDFHDFHYLLAMDRTNLGALEGRKPMGARASLGLLLSHSDRELLEVPDPYYDEVDGFGACLDLIATGAEGFLAKITKHHFSSK